MGLVVPRGPWMMSLVSNKWDRFPLRSEWTPAWYPKQPVVLMVGYQLDDEPNLYMGNGWKSPFPSTLNWLSTGFQEDIYGKSRTVAPNLHQKFHSPVPLATSESLSRLAAFFFSSCEQIGCPQGLKAPSYSRVLRFSDSAISKKTKHLQLQAEKKNMNKNLSLTRIVVPLFLFCSLASYGLSLHVSHRPPVEVLHDRVVRKHHLLPPQFRTPSR